MLDKLKIKVYGFQRRTGTEKDVKEERGSKETNSIKL